VPAAITIEWYDQIDLLAPEWAALADRTGADPFRRPGWVGAWHEAFGRGELVGVAARHGGELVAVLPLQRSGRMLSSTANWHTPVFGPVWERPDAVAKLGEALFASCPRRILLAFVDSDDPLRESVLMRARGARYRTLDVTVQRSPYLDLKGDWETLWQRMSSKRRNTLKRRRRKLEERGELTLRVLADGAQLGPPLEEALRVEALGWKGRRGTAIESRPDTHLFYRRVAAWAGSEGTLRLALLRVDDRLVAFDYALESRGRHYLLKTGFDPAYSDCAPGIVLRTMMIERAYALGLERYEFLGGEDDYKREWTQTTDDRRRIQAFAPSPGGLAGWAAFRYGRPAAKRALEHVRR